MITSEMLRYDTRTPSPHNHLHSVSSLSFIRSFIHLLTNNVNMRVFPLAKGGSRLNSDTLFTFQIHTVHFGTDTIFPSHVVDGIDSPCVEQNAFRQGRFSTEMTTRKEAKAHRPTKRPKVSSRL